MLQRKPKPAICVYQSTNSFIHKCLSIKKRCITRHILVKFLTFEDKGQPPKFLEIKDQDLDWHQISYLQYCMLEDKKVRSSKF